MSRKRAAATHRKTAWRRDFIVIAISAFLLSFAAEAMTAPLFVPAEPGIPAGVRHFAAALLQSIVVLLIHGRGWMVFHRPDWFVLRSGMRWAYILTAAPLMAAAIEFMAVRSRLWSYSPLMPTIPFVRIGIVPPLQTTIVAVAVFLLAARLRKRGPR
jgi:hypothetical protein